MLILRRKRNDSAPELETPGINPAKAQRTWNKEHPVASLPNLDSITYSPTAIMTRRKSGKKSFFLSLLGGSAVGAFVVSHLFYASGSGSRLCGSGVGTCRLPWFPYDAKVLGFSQQHPRASFDRVSSLSNGSMSILSAANRVAKYGKQGGIDPSPMVYPTPGRTMKT
ncbi:hypothetical protein BX600DRAFT_246658 [Xylariales sp. PMI_506]|nr:hypothetical protein BX600DRAFT_246658 [Xylariales sp. PMI_506]